MLAQLPHTAELILIDDGSRDGTWEVMRNLASHDPRVRAFSLATELGKAQALALATASSRGEILVTLDGESHWFEGLQLIAVYLVLGIAFYFVP